MKIAKIILVAIVLPLFSFTAHKYYLSMTDIEYNEKSKSLEVIINVFMDDIELAVNKDYNVNLQLSTKYELKKSNEYFEKYLKKKLLFKADQKNLSFNYLGKEYDGDLVYFYLEIPQVSEPELLEVTNKILTTHFEDQRNVVKFKIGKKRTSEILTKSNDKALLKL